MIDDSKNLVSRFKKAYHLTKRGLVWLAAILLVVVLFLDRVPRQIINDDVASNFKIAAGVVIGLIALQILLEIYERLDQSLTSLPILKSNDLLSNIYKLLEKERKVEIDFIGVAGRNGWQKVISYLLDATDDQHCILDKRSVKIRIALINNKALKAIGDAGKIYAQVDVLADGILSVKERLIKAGYKNVEIEFYRFDHIPTMVGMLINKNYLYLGATYWQRDPDELLKLRGGGQQYIAYDKNDVFGGAFYIERFEGWLDFYCSEENKIA